jgi:hypothetical protein
MMMCFFEVFSLVLSLVVIVREMRDRPSPREPARAARATPPRFDLFFSLCFDCFVL